ncbi:MAG: TRZ/ATZ family hydrolase [Lautropia sp.]
MSAAPLIIRPRWIAPVTAGSPVLAGQAVAVVDGRIAAIGPQEALRSLHPQATLVDRPDHLLIPGLVNAHSHAAMTLLRGAGDDMPLKAWLEQRIWPIEAALVGEDFVYDGAVLGCREMLLAGITCFNDMYFFPQASARAARDLGMKAVVGIVVFEFPSAYGTGPDDYLAKGLALRDSLRDDRSIRFALAPHAPYTVSDASFERVATLAAELQLPIHTHLHETAHEIAESIATHGVRPIERMRRLGVLGPDLIAVHAVHLDADDIDALATAGASVAHCPHSNLKLASGFAPTPALLAAGVNIAFGTDGAASNNRLDLLSEARLAGLLAKGLSGDAACFDAHRLLYALTKGGADALGIGDETGSIEIGKAADLVALDLCSLDRHLSAEQIHDPVSTLIHSNGRESVTDVWVDGNHVVEARQFGAAMSRTAITGVLGRSTLWHNRLGEFVPDRAS